MKKPTIGFVGLGTMGGPMALNLLAAGWPVCVFHPRPERLAPFIRAGASAARSVAELADACSTIWLMLPDDAAVRDTVTVLLAASKAERIVIDSSTIHPSTTRELAAALADSQMHYLDAPVTGSQPQAKARQLMFLVGGEQSPYRKAIPLFESLGRRHVHLGASGTGTSIKLAANLMGAAHMLALAEALSLVERAGIDPSAFLDIVNQSGARSVVSEVKGTKVIKGDWSADFALRLMLKDVNLAMEWAGDLNVNLPLATCTAALYRLAMRQLGGDFDMCSVARIYNKEAAIVS